MSDDARVPNRRWGRLLLLGAVVLGLAFGAAACGGDDDAATPAAAEPAPAEPAPAEPAPAEPAEKLKVALLLPGPITDGGYSQSFDEAGAAVLSEFGDQIEWLYTENIPFGEEMTQIAEQYVREGANVLIDSTAYGEVFTSVCEANPDVICLEAYGLRPLGENESAFYSKHWLPTYLIGVAAGHLTETNKIGSIGSFEIPLVFAQINALTLGCQSVNPDCETLVVFQNSWFDPAQETEISNSLVDAGADVLYSFLDDPATVATAEERGVWGASAIRDQPEFAPARYVTGYTFDWSGILTKELNTILDGTWTPGRIELTELGDGVVMGTWGPNVPQEVQDEVQGVMDRIQAGENPFVGEIYDTGRRVARRRRGRT